MPTPTSLPTSITANVTANYESDHETAWGLLNSWTSIPAQTKTGSHTLILADSGEVIEMNSASATTVTVPPNSSVAFPVGTVIEVFRYGTGTVTLQAGSGVTLLSPGGALALRVRYSSAGLRKRATDEWVVSGDTA